MGGIVCRCPVMERRMWALGVVISHPRGDSPPRMIEPEEQALIEKLIAHPPVEGFDVAVLRWLAGCDVVPFDAVLLRPGEDRVGGQFGSVIGDDHLGLAAL